MDLHSIAVGYVSAVNPVLLCQLQPSTGNTTAPDGTQTPSYGPAEPIYVQCQALTYNDLHQISGLNIQGTKLAMYIQGEWEGLVRSEQKGGDLITTPNGQIWLCVQVLENWYQSAGWTKLAAVLQNGS